MNDGGNINGAGTKPAVEPSSGVSNPTNPLANLEGVVAAAKLEAAAAQAEPVQVPAETQEGQFVNQFGSGLTPPVAEVPTLKPEDSQEAPVTSLDPGPEPAAEAAAPEEKTPAEKLKEQIAASVDAFLEEVTQKQAVTS